LPVTSRDDQATNRHEPPDFVTSALHRRAITAMLS